MYSFTIQGARSARSAARLLAGRGQGKPKPCGGLNIGCGGRRVLQLSSTPGRQVVPHLVRAGAVVEDTVVRDARYLQQHARELAQPAECEVLESDRRGRHRRLDDGRRALGRERLGRRRAERVGTRTNGAQGDRRAAGETKGAQHFGTGNLLVGEGY